MNLSDMHSEWNPSPSPRLDCLNVRAIHWNHESIAVSKTAARYRFALLAIAEQNQTNYFAQVKTANSNIETQ